MLAMSRGLMSDPKILLLDEPSMGLAPNLVDQIFDTISELHGLGTTILLVEQNAKKALEIAESRLRHRDRHRSCSPAGARTCATTRWSRRRTSASTDACGVRARRRSMASMGTRGSAPS